ncbi:MAG: recombinase family protein, partial [Actinomycetota bacterium]|nr:recombinase family protein [Actinomycetota bacterium]
MMPRRAIGIVRVSQVNGRDGESFASPAEQRDRIAAECERLHLRLLDTTDEMDVSGGTPLQQRHGLRHAVEAVEAGDADVIVAAYFDRLVRSLRVQGELVDRVEAAGGQVLAVDVGQITNGSAGQWLSGTMLGAVSEYQRRTAKERSAGGQQRAVARGVLPYPNVPPGYKRGSEGVLVRDPVTAPVVADAFALRADGATIHDVRAYLAQHGIERSYHGVTALLASRVVLGEIHFGGLVNLQAHEAIVDAGTWRRVQRVSTPRGRRAKSERLLARLGVLRCASCDARMVVGTSNHSQYPLYRCPPNGDCQRRVTISATVAEQVVVDAVRKALDDVQGAASATNNVRAAERELEHAQRELDGAIGAYTATGVADEPAARERLA